MPPAALTVLALTALIQSDAHLSVPRNIARQSMILRRFQLMPKSLALSAKARFVSKVIPYTFKTAFTSANQMANADHLALKNQSPLSDNHQRVQPPQFKPMRHKIEIFQDVTAAAATAISTDHSRALSGAEWLQQLASELVAVIKAEAAPEAPQEPYDESPGKGWRWLKPGEVINESDMVAGMDTFAPVTYAVGCPVAPGQYCCYRRRI